MTKKTETGSGVLAFEAMSDEARKTKARSSRRKSRVASKSRSSLMQIDFQQTRASYHFTDRMQGYGLKPLRQNELNSLYALFAWVANEQSSAPETVQSMTEVQFHVKDVTGLQQKDYDEVIKFLVDLRIDELRH
jgi:hypothetical protein